MTDGNVKRGRGNLKHGVSGMLRIKNDACFIKRCVDSCIDALDELVIVFNDCCDDSEDVIENVRLMYPEKIKVFEYKPKVYGVNLTREEYEFAKNLPKNSPHLLCNYYNFALSKVTYEYALKIDADQIYFADHLKAWCDFCRKVRPMRYSLKCFCGWLFQIYLSAYRFFSIKIGYLLPIIPKYVVTVAYPFYLEYARYLFSHDKACLSMAGVNVVEEDDEQFVSLGAMKSGINILPPFNGEGDHVIFKVSERTYYEKYEMAYYNKHKTSTYSLIEMFVHPYQLMFVGFFWTHISAMRPSVADKVKKARLENPSSFMQMREFLGLKYKQILKKTDKNMFNLFQRILFAFIYKANSKQLKSSLFEE